MVDKKIVWIAAGLVSAGAALGLAWVSNRQASVTGWGAYLALLAVMGAAVWAAWYSIREDKPPGWLLGLTLGAVALRLALGVFWTVALPLWGTGTEQQQAGYIMYDPYERDADAWELAQSSEPLRVSFNQYSPYDQYGGLLYLSALVYRYLGPDAHQPLLIIVITAAASGLAAVYVWGFSRRAWGAKTAKLAAWSIALYPDAVLQGSSQMREAFMVTLVAAGLYFLSCFWRSRTLSDGVRLGLILAISLALSWPFAGLVLVVLLIASIYWGREVLFPRLVSWQTGLFALLAVGALASIVALNLEWISKATYLQTYITEGASGIVQLMFELLPESFHLPFVVGYGVLRPLLPAALVYNGSNAFGQAIMIWRSLGWTALLVLLGSASFHALRTRNWYQLPGALLLFNWAVIVTASLRGGGDDWDNPRYRVPFAGIQAALAAWAVVQQQERKDPWLRRIVVISGLTVFWVLVWYLPRYTELPYWLGRPFDAIGLGLFSGGLYLMVELVRGSGEDQSRDQSLSTGKPK